MFDLLTMDLTCIELPQMLINMKNVTILKKQLETNLKKKSPILPVLFISNGNSFNFVNK